MTNGVPKGDGTSRAVRSQLPASYEELRALAANGNWLVDVLFNASGWTTQPTMLNQANVLQNSTLSLFGLPNSGVPNDVFKLLTNAAFNDNGAVVDVRGNPVGLQVELGSYTGTGTYGATSPTVLTFNGTPQLLVIKPNPTSTNASTVTDFSLLAPRGVERTSTYIESISGTMRLVNIVWDNNAARVWVQEDAYNAARSQMNSAGTSYVYLALCTV